MGAVVTFLFAALALASTPRPAVGPFDLSSAVVVAAPDASLAATLLVEEIASRSGVRLQSATAWPDKGPVIAIGAVAARSAFAGAFAERLQREVRTDVADGFRLLVVEEQARPVVLAAGGDARGTLFAVGRLLRALELGRGRVVLPTALDVATAPKLLVRGQQFRFDPGTCFDGWAPAAFERYLRELVVFGNNAVGLVVGPGTRPAVVSAARTAAKYGLAVGLVHEPTTVAAEWAAILEEMPRLDGIIISGGTPQALVALGKRERERLRKRPSGAQLWIVPPVDDDDADAFFSLAGPEATWLDGVVYRQQPRLDPLSFVRKKPQRLALLYSPDLGDPGGEIPVPEWDAAFARSQRAPLSSPRPQAMAALARTMRSYSAGFLGRPAGCQDDVNQMVWSALAWDDVADLGDTLRQYARFAIGAEDDDGVAQALLALERNWSGQLLSHDAVSRTLAQTRALERAASTATRSHWRFQLILLRATIDAMLRGRLVQETSREEEARGLMASGQIDAAAKLLDGSAGDPVLRARAVALAAELERSTSLRIAIGDQPLSDAPFLRRRLREIRALTGERRGRALAELLDRTNPGPGGTYDDLGRPSAQPHLVRRGAIESEPGSVMPTSTGLAGDVADDLPAAWRDCAVAGDGDTVEMRWTGLDRRADYRVRVVYVGKTRVRMLAEGRSVHPFMGTKLRPLEFEVPRQATRDGELTLTWIHEADTCQIAEVWLLRAAPRSSRP